MLASADCDPLVDEIYKQAPEDRLSTAIWLLQTLTGRGTELTYKLIILFDMPPTEAALLNFMITRHSRVINRESLYAAIYPYESDVELKIVDQYVHRIRTKLSKILELNSDPVTTYWAAGYSLTKAASNAILDRVDTLEHLDVAQRLSTLYKIQQIEKQHPSLENNGHPWSHDEDETLIAHVTNQLSNASIARAMGRSLRAITDRKLIMKRRDRLDY